ncbi:flagellar hook-basal body protein FliE [Rosistilla oblonga]|uniref:Flagellar hook-basal body complex protein FliE n=1 Tax=Rosistilla oblonga TaxID=2527990 RepID=A0A518IPF8_9BACT|nr:flagellar hook-basal body complex protein FliE [Rosistilla oblonga]QDV11060.1 flagellar hook-basal body protein FliE [Rosistilla oblonga]QDV54981.1 flagellar hook-basal body protein FliE [Rosistilla oblonga]
MNPVSLRIPPAQMPLAPPVPGTQPVEPGYKQFTDLLVDGFQEVNAAQNSANASVHDMLTGKDVDRIEVLTSVQKADMSFRLMQQIRNKLVEAYREINQMQI